jgi:hypothetical protein
VLTATGTAGLIQGETNLRFNGSALNLTGSLNSTNNVSTNTDFILNNTSRGLFQGTGLGAYGITFNNDISHVASGTSNRHVFQIRQPNNSILNRFVVTDGGAQVTGSLEVFKSGSVVFDVQGSFGQLFSVTDNLFGDIFSVADISGIPILNVNSNGNVDVDGELRVTGDVFAYFSSDERLKNNITPISGSLDKLKQINGYEFDWNEKSNYEGHDIGVIAQEIEKVLPELVSVRRNGYLGVDYPKIVALLIETNKELLKRVEILESKIK